MTSPYSAKYVTGFQYFKESVKENFNIEINFNDEEEIKFKDFYKFMNKFEYEFFLKKKSTSIIEYVKKNMDKNVEITYKLKDGKINFTYYKYQSKNFDIIVNIEKLSFKKRYTKKNYEINLNLLDKKKTEISIRAN
jgi:hypothetical protein